MSKHEAAMQEVSKEDEQALSQSPVKEAVKKSLFVEKPEVKEELPIEQPLGYAYPRDVKMEITGADLHLLQNALKPFEYSIAVLNNLHNKLIQEGKSKPYFTKDIDQETGQLRANFWN